MTSVVPLGPPVQCVSLCCRRRDGIELTLFPAPAFSTGLPLFNASKFRQTLSLSTVRSGLSEGVASCIVFTSVS
jgi:hypothetical protein